MLDFLLGLPYLREGPLWQTARRLEAPVLVSANALSLWRRDAVGLRQWSGFDRRMLRLVAEHPVSLDSGGFVASVLYAARRSRCRNTWSCAPQHPGSGSPRST